MSRWCAAAEVRPAVGDLALDALRDDLVVAGDLGLEVAVLEVDFLPRLDIAAERAHAARRT